MTTATRRLAVTVLVAAVACASAACSTKLSTAAPPVTTAAPTTTIPGAQTPAQTKAADYRAQLTYLMVEHVYLLGRVTREIVAAGGLTPPTTTEPPTTAPAPTPTPTTTAATGRSTTTSTTATTATTVPETTTTTTPALSVPGADDAAAALDKNSHDITDLLAQAQGYGSDFAAAFSPLWTARIDDIAQYATAKATADTAGATAATKALATNATSIAQLVHRDNKFVAVTTVSNPGTGLADELGPDNAAATAFVDSQAAKGATAVADLVKAAEKMPHTAVFLAAAAAKLDPDQFPGTATGTAANLRASLTAALVEHVELAALTVDQLAAGAPGTAEAASLNANTGELDNVVIVNFGDQAGRDFTTLWNSYVTSLEAYARAKGSGGQAPDLTGTGQEIGAFFAAHGPQFSAALIGSDAQQVVDALRAVIDADASQSPAVIALRVAAGYVPKLGSDVAEGIARLKPTQYLP